MNDFADTTNDIPIHTSTQPDAAQTLKLYEAVIGEPRRAYYLDRFFTFDKQGKTGLTWNWAAFASALNWSLYRGMWRWAVGYGVVMVALVLLVLAAGKFVLDLPNGSLLLAWGVLLLVTSVATAVTADALYYRHCERRVNRALIEAAGVDDACVWLRNELAPRRRTLALVAGNVALGLPALGVPAALALYLIGEPQGSDIAISTHVAGGKIERAIPPSPVASASAENTTAMAVAVAALPANSAAAATEPLATGGTPGVVPATVAAASALAQATSPPTTGPASAASAKATLAPSLALAQPTPPAAPTSPAAVIARATPVAPLSPLSPVTTPAEPPPLKLAPATTAPLTPASTPTPAPAPAALAAAKPAKSAPPGTTSAGAPKSSSSSSSSSNSSRQPSPNASASGRYYVQIGIFVQPANIERIRAKLATQKSAARFEAVDQASVRGTRVRVGPFVTRAQADAAAARISGLDLPALVVVVK